MMMADQNLRLQARVRAGRTMTQRADIDRRLTELEAEIDDNTYLVAMPASEARAWAIARELLMMLRTCRQIDAEIDRVGGLG